MYLPSFQNFRVERNICSLKTKHYLGNSLIVSHKSFKIIFSQVVLMMDIERHQINFYDHV